MRIIDPVTVISSAVFFIPMQINFTLKIFAFIQAVHSPVFLRLYFLRVLYVVQVLQLNCFREIFRIKL